MLLGAAFSLWRAAFLIRGSRTREELNAHALAFLDTLLWDNAITYQHDSRLYGWTSGYYVNNAAIRLTHAAKVLGVQTLQLRQLEKFVADQWSNAEAACPNVAEGWEWCFSVLEVGIQSLVANAPMQEDAGQ